MCLVVQNQLNRDCSRLLYDIVQLQSQVCHSFYAVVIPVPKIVFQLGQVRQLDIRRSAQIHVTSRLHDYASQLLSYHLKKRRLIEDSIVDYLRSLQQLPRLYNECLKELGHRQVYEKKVWECVISGCEFDRDLSPSVFF